MTAPVPAGPTDAQGELREEIAEIIYNRDCFAGDDPWTRAHPIERDRCRRGADAVLALRTVRDALAAQETVRRVDFAVNEFYWLAENGRTVIDTAHIRRALAGEQTWRSPDCPKRAHVALDCPADDPAEHDPRAGGS